MIKPRQKLVPASKYSIKCPYSMNAEYITVHNTANDASAENEIDYMIRNNYEVSYHFAIDDKEVVQGLPLNRNGWHAGDGGNGPGNRKSIGVEICYSKSGGERYKKAEQLAVKFIAQLLKERGWGIDRVKSHKYWTELGVKNGRSSYVKNCPHRIYDEGRWQSFLNEIENELKGALPQPKPSTLYRVRLSWADEKSQIGAYSELKNAIKIVDDNPKYKVFNDKGEVVYEVKTAQPKAPSKTYKVVATINGYYTAADAKSRKNAKTKVNAGDYYIYNEHSGMINVTKKAGMPGAWINPADNKAAVYHIVNAGETLWSISRKYNTTIDNIAKLNNLKDKDLIYPKQKLRIK